MDAAVCVRLAVGVAAGSTVCPVAGITAAEMTTLRQLRPGAIAKRRSRLCSNAPRR